MSNSVSITIAISTYNDSVANVVLPASELGLRVILIHQVTDPKNNIYYEDIYSEIKHGRKDVQIFLFNEVGLSKSRNRAIELANSDYIIFSDDDNQYISKVNEFVNEELVRFSFPKFISFRIEDGNGNFFKKYSSSNYKHTYKTIFRLSSIENVYDLRFIKEHNLSFDENFGLGAVYPSCEQPIFAKSIISHGGSGCFVPKTITYHPLENSGEDFFTANNAVARREMFMRIFGKYIGRLMYIVFVFKKLKNVPNQYRASFIFSLFGFHDQK